MEAFKAVIIQKITRNIKKILQLSLVCEYKIEYVLF